jgi:hypothetical protein
MAGGAGVTLHLGCTVRALDLVNKQVTDHAGQVYGFQRLLLHFHEAATWRQTRWWRASGNPSQHGAGRRGRSARGGRGRGGPAAAGRTPGRVRGAGRRPLFNPALGA